MSPRKSKNFYLPRTSIKLNSKNNSGINSSFKLSPMK
jgi:hypothetical protein